MKRVPPSVKMKEEVELLLRGEAAPTHEAEDPMRGFLRQLARYILQVHIEAEATEPGPGPLPALRASAAGVAQRLRAQGAAERLAPPTAAWINPPAPAALTEAPH